MMRGDTIGRVTGTAVCGLTVALLTVCSWIAIPLPVPVTLQTFAVFLALELLGGRRGIVSIFAYILLGAAGLPVFSGFRGGTAALLGPTGGFVIGFLLIGLCYCLFTLRTRGSTVKRVAALLLGLVLCYGFGAVWYAAIYMNNLSAEGILSALGVCVLPFILPDLCKLALAMLVAGRVAPALKAFGNSQRHSINIKKGDAV